MKIFAIAGIVFVVGLCIMPAVAFSANGDLPLETPRPTLDVDIIHALSQRNSAREFTGQDIGIDELSTLLWAANGVNRPDGKRTAFSPFMKSLVDVYVVSDKGLYQYNPDEQKLDFLSGANYKAAVMPPDFPAGASSILVLVAKPKEISFKMSKKDRVNYCYLAAGAIVQNVLLIAGAMELGTCFVTEMNEKEVRKSLLLDKDHFPLGLMPVGYPK